MPNIFTANEEPYLVYKQGEMKVVVVGIERGNRIEGGCVCKSSGRVGRW